MSDKFKKVLYIAGFIALVLLMAFLIYWAFFRTPSTQIVSPGIPGQVVTPGIGGLPISGPGSPNYVPDIGPSGLPVVGSGVSEEPSDIARGGYTKLDQLTDNSVISPSLDIGGALRYYDPESGKFFRQLADGSWRELSNKIFYNVKDVTWAKNADRAVLSYPDGANVIYDFGKDRQYSLPKDLSNFDFNKNGAELAAKLSGPRDQDNWLVAVSNDGTGLNFLEPLGENKDKVQVAWSPNNQVVAMYKENNGLDSNRIIFLGKNKENFPSFETIGRDFKGKWSPSGNELMYTTYTSTNGLKPEVWFVQAGGDKTGANNRNLGLNTYLDKCVVSQDSGTAYCAVPREMPEGSAWFPQFTDTVPDDFYKVDLNTGQKSLLAVPANNGVYNVKNLFITPGEDKLVFYNKTDSKVYSFKLK